MRLIHSLAYTTCFATLALLASACSSGGGYGHFTGTFGDMSVAPAHDGGGDLAVPGGDLGGQRVDFAVVASCGDGIKNGQETDVDCGGTSCGPCADGQACRGNTDCQNRQCTAGICIAAASCNNGIRDGSETDVDCGGGSCGPCGNGLRCLDARDCSSGTCQFGQCVDACTDGTQDGKESDIDCGGPVCSACSSGSACLQNRDCTSLRCTNGLCCDSGFANCSGIAADGCNVNLNGDAKNCGSCGHACPNGQSCKSGACAVGAPVMVGSYDLQTGILWSNMPPTLSCVEECAIRFGGVAANYGCSTVANTENHQATLACYGITGCQIKADTYKLGVTYVTGACSAFVNDGVCAAATNYCWR